MSKRIQKLNFAFAFRQTDPNTAKRNKIAFSCILSSVTFPNFYSTPFNSFFVCTFDHFKSIYAVDLRVRYGVLQIKPPPTLVTRKYFLIGWYPICNQTFSDVSVLSVLVAVERLIDYYKLKFSVDHPVDFSEFYKIKKDLTDYYNESNS